MDMKEESGNDDDLRFILRRITEDGFQSPIDFGTCATFTNAKKIYK